MVRKIWKMTDDVHCSMTSVNAVSATFSDAWSQNTISVLHDSVKYVMEMSVWISLFKAHVGRRCGFHFVFFPKAAMKRRITWVSRRCYVFWGGELRESCVVIVCTVCQKKMAFRKIGKFFWKLETRDAFVYSCSLLSTQVSILCLCVRTPCPR